jgi:metal-responsive CopG/Arc/MetJ family transcriptional regulator
MAKKKFNITLDPEVLDEFCKYSSKYGTSISSWIEVQMKDFIEEEKEVEEIRKQIRAKKGTK